MYDLNPSEKTALNKSIARAAERHRAQGGRVVEVGGHYWSEYQKTVVPIGPATSDYSLSLEQERQLLAAFPGALMLRYTTGLSENPAWFALLCDRFTDVEQMKGEAFDKNARYGVKRALKDCVVEQISAKVIAESGYAVYAAALQGYNTSMADEAAFKRKFEESRWLDAQFEDLIECFGVFHQNQLIAWVVSTVFGNVEVAHNQIKIDPNFRNARPLYALAYVTNQHYLGQQKVRQVMIGYRSLLHPTGVQQTLCNNFAFKQQGLQLRLSYRPPVQMAMNLAYPFRQALSKKSSQIAAVMSLEEIRRSYIR